MYVYHESVEYFLGVGVSGVMEILQKGENHRPPTSKINFVEICKHFQVIFKLRSPNILATENKTIVRDLLAATCHSVTATLC